MNSRLPKVKVSIAGTTKSARSLHAASVAEAVSTLTATDSELARRLLLPDGRVRGTVAIFVGDEDIRFGNGLDTALHDGDEIVLLFAVAGG